jgi:DNA-binding NarL/FixJ family response regulator
MRDTVCQTEDRGMTGDRPIRVFFVGDHRVLVDALVAALSAEPDMAVVATANSIADVRGLLDVQADVVLMDYVLGDGTGTEACASSRRTSPPRRSSCSLPSRTTTRSSRRSRPGRTATSRRTSLSTRSSPPCARDVQNIMAKLGTHFKLETVAFALRHGLVAPPHPESGQPFA